MTFSFKFILQHTHKKCWIFKKSSSFSKYLNSSRFHHHLEVLIVCQARYSILYFTHFTNETQKCVQMCVSLILTFSVHSGSALWFVLINITFTVRIYPFAYIWSIALVLHKLNSICNFKIFTSHLSSHRMCCVLVGEERKQHDWGMYDSWKFILVGCWCHVFISSSSFPKIPKSILSSL